MDDLSVFRRFFVTSSIIQEIIGAITGRGVESSVGDTISVPPVNPFIQPEAPIDAKDTIGGPAPIPGSRPVPSSRPRTPRRRSPPIPQLPNTARYQFPSGE